MKFLKSISNFIYILLFFIFISGLIIIPLSYKQIAYALYGNYDRTVTPNDGDDSIDIVAWNDIKRDFLAKGGAPVDDNSMQGDLSMGGHRITNLDDPVDGTDGATVQYVNHQIALAGSAGGGDTYINWGRAGCADGDDVIYTGYAFSARYDYTSGGSNPICLQSGGSGATFNTTYADSMYPVKTGSDTYLPTSGTSIRQGMAVRCALCHDAQGTCYIRYGNQDCPGSGFQVKYAGYVLGSFGTSGTDGFNNPTQRMCVNGNFDNSSTNFIGTTDQGAIWFGSRIQSLYSLSAGYTPNTFIQCAVCCN